MTWSLPRAMLLCTNPDLPHPSKWPQLCFALRPRPDAGRFLPRLGGPLQGGRHSFAAVPAQPRHTRPRPMAQHLDVSPARAGAGLYRRKRGDGTAKRRFRPFGVTIPHASKEARKSAWASVPRHRPVVSWPTGLAGAGQRVGPRHAPRQAAAARGSGPAQARASDLPPPARSKRPHDGAMPGNRHLTKTARHGILPSGSIYQAIKQ